MRRAQMRTMPARIEKHSRGNGFLSVLARVPLASSSPPSPLQSSKKVFAWRDRKNDANPSNSAVHSRSAYRAVSMEGDRPGSRCLQVASASLYSALQTDVSARAPILPNFPAHPRSLAAALVPRPITPAHAYRAPGTPILRHLAFCFVRRGERPAGLGFQQQISRADCARLWPGVRAKFLAGASAESTPAALGAGRLASLRARVSRG